MNYSGASLLRIILFNTPANAWWISVLVWIIGITTFSLLLRSYLIPWLLSALSKHVRIRTVSLWSIRGLYIRAGHRIIRVDRVRYGYSRRRGINVRLDGLNIELGRSAPKLPPLPTLRHSRRLTLADFAPSPIAHRLWNLLSSAYALVEPFFRPLIRTWVVAGLRLLIRWLPHIISALNFEAHSTTFAFPELPGTLISAEKLTLHANLAFTELEKAADTGDHTKMPRSVRSKRSYGVAAWRRRFTASFKRTLDRAWGTAQGKAAITIKLLNIGGSTQSVPDSRGREVQFLRLPGAINFQASMVFNPREGTTDAHSLDALLNIGDCSFEVDTLKLLLKSFKPREPKPKPDGKEIIASPSVYSGSPVASPRTADSDVLFSPQSSISPGTDGSMSALLSPEIISPPSPASPFLEALSASIRPRRRHVYRPRTRLKDIKDSSVLCVLNRARIEITTVTFVTQRKWGQDPYELKIQGIAVSSDLCNNRSEDPFHRHCLGRGKKLESYDSDSYDFKFSIHKISVERRTKADTLLLLTLETVDFQALATQWPAPWLTPSPFMSGDPNASLLAIRGKIGGIEVTERLERLRELVAHMEPSTKNDPFRPTAPFASLNLPRFAFELQCGLLRGRIICADVNGSKPFAVELRNNGFVISAESSFGQECRVNTRQQLPDHERRPLRMGFKLSFILDPTLVRVRSRTKVDTRRFTSLRSFDADFLDDPSILSIESFESYGEGHAVASIEHDNETVASVVPSSLILDLHVSSDALCIEAWNPHVVVAIHQLMSIMPTQEDRFSSPTPSKPLLDRLPAGISATVAIARFVVFVASPDINPKDNLDLSRGFACRTGLSMHYSSMHSSHAHRFQDLPHRAQTRHKLDLPQEQIVDAVSTARASAITQNASAHFRISLSELSLRSAAATQYDADNPFIFERDDSAFIHLECLHVPRIKIDLCLSGKRGPVLSKTGDSCELSAVIPNIRARFQLSHVYSIMLAIHGLKSLLPNSPRRTSNHQPPAQINYRVKVVVTTFQVLGVLRTQRLALRVDGIETHVFTSRPLSVQLNKLVAWVHRPSRINKWEDENGHKWEEFIGFQSLHASVTPSEGGPSISLDGESARLRIPFGYILADLILELSVTAKAIRHLGRLTAQQQYSPMPAPEPEGPKVLPDITIRLRCLCLEASDDPFERKLADIWRCGLEAVTQRIEREEAFKAKVAAIYQAESEVPPFSSVEGDQDYHFGADHSVSIEEARRRLDEVHELDWTLRLQNLRQKYTKAEDVISQSLRGKHAMTATGAVPNIVEVTPTERIPPIFRVLLSGVFLTLQGPSFPEQSLQDFLHEQGGLPYETAFSLLVPVHLNFTLSSLHVTLRDYPLPLFSIPPNADRNIPAWEFDTDLVIAEEMGSEHSVWWIDCPVLEPNHGVRGAPALSISVPKTVMPVKSYANPVIRVTTNATTILSWGVSYTPAIQDLMRVIETLSAPPLDLSPPVGFWDKMRLIFHWSLVATFKGEVRFHMKGSRDPQKLSDEGAGFVLSWQGNTKLLVARGNEDKELIQVISDSMLIAIPNLEHLYPRNQEPIFSRRIPETSKPFRKICVEVCSGVRFGVGFVLERACGSECLKCTGSAFHRQCRYFDFRPHYEVRLETKAQSPEIKTPADSYDGFRSDFIHMSISLASSTRNVVPGSKHEPSSIHLTPKAFAYFWSWSGLFDSALSLPTRQGSYYPPRIASPKLGRHLATLKYRLHIHHLFIMHAYIDESRETWADGVLPWIGVKAMIEELQADLHQRDEESVVPGLLPDTTKVHRRKPVYAAEVSLKGLDLRALLAIFKEPFRETINMVAPPQRSNYRAHNDLPLTPPVSVWHDTRDFIEVDWSPPSEPILHLLPVVTCPQFTYFKRHSVVPSNSTLASKFGDEESHSCLLGKSLAVPQVQIEIAESRIRELRRLIRNKKSKNSDNKSASLEKMVTLLEDYVSLLRGPDTAGNSEKSSRSYLMPSYAVSPDEWAEFENVYHIHCPKIVMDSAIRDIMMQYYYCSRARKGLEYHMATRAVKFIRDQAEAALDDESDESVSWEDRNTPGATATAHMAASALKKMLKGDPSKPSVEISTSAAAAQSLEEFDPLQGWSEGISLRKSHCCLLLKPQIVMRGEGSKGTLVVAAVQAKLQIFAIMDNSNADDPICGKVMSRSHTSLSGLQTFAPAALTATENVYVPLEVLLDLRCESSAFDQLVPQTNATFHYDKFNRLRLRNNITSVARTSTDRSPSVRDSHLQDQTDLIRVHIPQFTVSASDEHFAAISHIVTHLLLFSDAAHKTRLEKLETLLFTYDFTDLVSAAQVVADLQGRLGGAIEAQRTAEYNHSRRLEGEEGQLEMLKLKAHIFLLSEELNFLFDAIKLAQDRYDDHTDQKSALLLHASSSEISWRMLDDRRDLLSKLVVQDINFYWLSRQDSSTSNNLSVSNLQAFDGSRHALWTEILSKHGEPANHPLLKRGLFLLATWTVLAPVGGITIYESFELSLHPMRLQIDARVGRRIMEYLWPARKHRNKIEDAKNKTDDAQKTAVDHRTSLDSPRALRDPKPPYESSKGELVPPLRKLGNSRSFTDLRAIAKDSLMVPTFHTMHSSETLRQIDDAEGSNKRKGKSSKKDNDATEMKIRTSQKSFVLVKISSMNLLLSIAKEGSFECTDARIKTRDLEYRNQTWSFEELVNQFIPSDTSWRGWVKMAFHQPLLPVLPVARELISKTKWIPSSSKAATQVDIKGPPPRLPRAKVLSIDDDSRLARVQSKYTGARSKSPSRKWRKASNRKLEPQPQITSLPLTDEPESFTTEAERPNRSAGRKRMMSLFTRSSSKGNSIGSSVTLRPSEEK